MNDKKITDGFISDFSFEFAHPKTHFYAKCRVFIKQGPGFTNTNDTTVIMTEFKHATEITLIIDYIATEIYRKYLDSLSISSITFIAYVNEFLAGEKCFIVDMEWDGTKFINPKWHRIPSGFIFYIKNMHGNVAYEMR